MDLLSYLELFKWGLLAGISLSISTALVSPFLILQRNSLFPHAITHLLLLSLLLLSLFKTFLPSFLHFPFLILITLLLSFLIYLLTKGLKIFEDTSTSIVTYLSLSLSLVIAGKTAQFDLTLLNYLFGSFLTVNRGDFVESLLVLFITIGFFYFFKDLWLAKCFEEEIPGIKLKRSQAFFYLLITLQSIVGVKLMGVLLVSSFFVFSATTALKLSSSFYRGILLSVLLNLIALFMGFTLSLSFDIPFSSALVIFMGLYVLILWIGEKQR